MTGWLLDTNVVRKQRLPGSAAILAACGLEARTPGPLSQTGTAQGSAEPPSHVSCITHPGRGAENYPLLGGVARRAGVG